MAEIILALLAALAPAVILAIIMIRKDNIQPEPKKWLWTAVGLGVLTIPFVLIIVYLFIPDFDDDTFWGGVLNSFLRAAVPEETCKFLALLIIAKTCKHFDEYFDGIVYAVCIGMGFAGLENILYVFGQGNWIIVSISRALVSVPMHYIFAVIMGAFFSLGWFDKRNRKVYLSAALILPIIVHGVYDSFCFTMALNPYVSAVILIAFLIGFKAIRKYTRKLIDSFQTLDINEYPKR